MRNERFSRPVNSLLLALILLVGIAAISQESRGQAGAATSAPAAAAPAKRARGAAAKTGGDEPSPYRITGRVVNSLTHSPVARAEITVSPMGQRRGNGRFAGRAGGQTAEAVADAEGRFTVEVPSAGGWSLSASAHGYHSQAYEEHDGYSTAIILTEANPVHGVTFQLTPAGAIEGYVLDEAGEAVRNAQLTLSLVPPATPDDQHPRAQARGSQRTDDRGYYNFSGLLAGSYDVRVQASPWYATNGAGGRFGGGIGGIAGGFSSIGLVGSNGGAASSAPDPLDVVYPVVWYPGVTDYAQATPIPLRGGETREADFRLSPIPGFHLRLAGAPQAQPEAVPSAGAVIRSNAYLTEVLPDGTESPVRMPMSLEPNGGIEFSGLAPGSYIVHQQGEGGSPASTATVRIADNSARTVDASQASEGVPVTVKVDPEADRPSLQISFRDVETGLVSFVRGRREFGAQGVRRGRGGSDEAAAKEADAPDRTISLQPGRYEVVMNGIGDLHLASIEAKGAAATGRTVTITGGAPVLTLHVASGRANLTGFVESHGKPVEGAMVLLVPATLGDPAGLDVTRRDQSNSDGSFDITNVLPGDYILVAIDHGWDVNWNDPATLRRFLMQGVPLDLTTPGDRKQTVEAQQP